MRFIDPAVPDSGYERIASRKRPGRAVARLAASTLGAVFFTVAGCTPIGPNEHAEARLERPAPESAVAAGLAAVPAVVMVQRRTPTPAYSVLPPWREIRQMDDFNFQVEGLEGARGQVAQGTTWWGSRWVSAHVMWPLPADPTAADRRRAAEVVIAVVNAVRAETSSAAGGRPAAGDAR
jgi:hypothetical protein